MGAKLEQILSREMTRGQFLMTLGMSLVSVFGFSTIMGILTGDTKPEDKGQPGYGRQNYGP